jgi:hypothetical protein
MEVRDWIPLADAFAVRRRVEVEVSFNIRFENGFVASRTRMRRDPLTASAVRAWVDGAGRKTGGRRRR